MKVNLPVATTNPVFSFEGHTVRVVVDKKGDPWFVAADVLEAFGHSRSARGGIIRKVAEADLRLYPMKTSVGVRAHSLISEAGLYKLVMRSDKPAAKPFQDWVTREVLPSIRKDGGYIMGEEKLKSGEMTEDEFILKAMTILKSKAERLTEERDHAQGIINDHLVNLTIDEWRALNGQYLTRSTILDEVASKELGLKVNMQFRTSRAA